MHATSHLNEKLSLRRKKGIFICYSKHSKGHVLLGEHKDGNVTEIESRDVNFLAQEFPSNCEGCRDLVLYELNESTLSCSVEQEDSEPTPLGNSGSVCFKITVSK